MVFPHVDGFLTIGRDGQQFIAKYGGDAKRVHLTTNTIDVERIRRECLAAMARRTALRKEYGLLGVTYLYVGRIWSGKGLDVLLDAYREARASLDGAASLLMVGEGPDRARLQARCRAEGIPGVVFTGFVPEDGLADFYAASDVFVFPSLGDPYGLVVDEAMASSLPVICSSACGEIRDRIRDGVNGFIVPAGAVGPLAQRMLWTARNPDLRSALAERGAASVAGHTHQLWAKEFELLVERILDMPRAT